MGLQSPLQQYLAIGNQKWHWCTHSSHILVDKRNLGLGIISVSLTFLPHHTKFLNNFATLFQNPMCHNQIQMLQWWKSRKERILFQKKINRSTTIFFIFCRNLKQVLNKGQFHFGIGFRNILIKINLQDPFETKWEWLNIMSNSLSNMEQWKHFMSKILIDDVLQNALELFKSKCPTNVSFFFTYCWLILKNVPRWTNFREDTKKNKILKQSTPNEQYAFIDFDYQSELNNLEPPINIGSSSFKRQEGSRTTKKEPKKEQK